MAPGLIGLRPIAEASDVPPTTTGGAKRDAARRGLWVASYAVGALLFVALYSAWIHFAWLGPFPTRAFVDISTTLTPLGIGALVILLARSLPRRRRVGGVLVGLACISWGVGNVAWTWYELVARVSPPYPSLADPGYLLLQPLMAAALLSMIAGSTAMMSRLRTLLDGLLIGAAVLFVGWALFLRPIFDYARHNDFSPLAQAVLLASPLGDLVLLSLWLLVISRAPPDWRPTLSRLGLGLAALTYADVGYWYLAAHDAYHSGSVFDPGWIAAFLAIGYSAIQPHPPVTSVQDPRPGWLLAALPLAPFGLATLAAIWVQAHEGVLSPFLFWNALLAISLVVTRQFVMLLENVQLRRHVEAALAEVAQARDQLEDRVEERTRELQENQSLLAGERSRFKAILESIGEGIVVIDMEGRLLFTNVVAKESLGIGQRICSFANWSETYGIYHPDGETLFANGDLPVYHALRGENVDRVEIFIRNEHLPEGGFFAVTARPLKDAAGKPFGSVAIYSDLAREKALEKLKDAFMSSATHELRTPVATIKGMTSMLLEGDYGHVPDYLKNTLNEMFGAANQQISLMDKLLETLEMDSGQQVYALENISLIELVQAAARIWAPLFQDKQLRLAVRFDHDIEKATVRAERTRLHQVLDHLMGNALKFTDQGGVTIEVGWLDDYIKVRISDTGIGISERDHHLLFRRFQQIWDIQQGKPQGVGLGLYLSRVILRKAGGDLWLEQSTLGTGSTFAFRLPGTKGEPLGTDRAPRTQFADVDHMGELRGAHSAHGAQGAG